MSLIKLARNLTQAEVDAHLKAKPWEVHPQEASGIRPPKPTSKMTAGATAGESKLSGMANKVKPYLTGKNLAIAGGVGLAGLAAHKLLSNKKRASMSLVKLALNIPVSHLKGDTKEIKEIRNSAQKIVKVTKEMNVEDKEAMKGK